MPLKYGFPTFPYEKLVSNSNHTLAFAGLVGKKLLDQIWTTLSQYDVVPTSFVQVGPSPA